MDTVDRFNLCHIPFLSCFNHIFVNYECFPFDSSAPNMMLNDMFPSFLIDSNVSLK